MENQASPTRATFAVLQYLKENGFQRSFLSLLDESGLEYIEKNEPPKANMLLHALTAYDDQQLMTLKPEVSEDNKHDEALLLHRRGEDEVIALPLSSHDYIHKGNLIAVQFSPNPNVTLLATGSVDKTVKVVDYDKNIVVSVIEELKAPVLALNFHPIRHTVIAIGSFNGSHFVVDYEKKDSKVLQAFSDHSKYVVSVKWSPGGQYLATASHDKTVNIYREESTNKWISLKTFPFLGTVEAIEWIKNDVLLVGVRNDNYLRAIDVTTLRETAKYNMNARGDDHVSFTAMHIAASPDGNFVLVATDRHRAILFRTGTARQVRNFYGTTNDSYSSPRVAWSVCGQFVYSTSQDNAIYVWDVATQKIVQKLEGHTQIVRDLCRHPQFNVLATASYDKTMRLWHTQKAVAKTTP